MAGIAAAAGATTASVGLGLFGYNRGNYMMDQKMHFGRFTAGCNMAMAQTNMYRADITTLTGLTVERMAKYQDICAMTATIITAIYCPGRLGLHTPPPPGWLMGLAFLNIAGTYLWLGLCIWLSLHAALRADSASTHMLTRFVRLPVPTQWMLDRARKFLSSFEEQPLVEAFRIPFTKHPGQTSGAALNEDRNIDDPDSERRARHGYDVPTWYRKEKQVDEGNTLESMLPYQARGTAPEHMEVYREIQNEWWPYDVYARISIFLAFMHLLHCWTYMQLGHHLAETRSVFAVGCVVLCMTTLQQIILTMDILPSAGEIPLHRLGPLAPWFAYVAIAIEYKRWYTVGASNVCVVLVYLAYAMHIIYTVQLLWLCSPDAKKPPEPAEAAGAAWWPGTWRLPSSFQHAIWLVAPPRSLDEFNDIVGEQRAASARQKGIGAGGGSPDDSKPSAAAKRKDIHRALGRQGESPAWFNVKVGLVAMLIGWLWLTMGYTIEVINQGTMHPSLLNAPGMPNNARDPRYRPAKPGKDEPVEVGTGGVNHGPAKGLHHGAVERRLGALQEATGPVSLKSAARLELAQKLRDLLPYLNDLAASDGAIAGSSQPLVPVAPALAPAAPANLAVRWPALFEPRLLACGPAGQQQGGRRAVALALSRHGRGAVIAAPTEGSEQGPSEASHFVLAGIAAFGPLVAASWDEAGLLLAAATGATLECPGAGPEQGRWHCRPLKGAKLPLSLGGRPFAGGSVAVTRGLAGEAPATLRAAVAFPGESAVALFSRAGREGAPWLPAGEARTSTPTLAASYSEDALLLTSADGSVMRMHLSDGSSRLAAAAIDGHEGHSWQASCGLDGGRVARLALRRAGAAAAWEPALLLG
mmetsp:Transcript_120561/g.257463  ORF Transcript_120561/g.257463 Transcript_120561/m.257463 type:complete len:868 (-) Transcript_120561:72-2675(-)